VSCPENHMQQNKTQNMSERQKISICTLAHRNGRPKHRRSTGDPEIAYDSDHRSVTIYDAANHRRSVQVTEIVKVSDLL